MKIGDTVRVKSTRNVGKIVDIAHPYANVCCEKKGYFVHNVNNLEKLTMMKFKTGDVVRTNGEQVTGTILTGATNSKGHSYYIVEYPMVTKLAFEPDLQLKQPIEIGEQLQYMGNDATVVALFTHNEKHYATVQTPVGFETFKHDRY